MRGVQHVHIGPRPHPEMAEVAAAQRRRPAAGGGADRLGEREVHLQHRGGDAEAHRRGVGGAGVAVRGDRDGGAGVEELARGGERRAGGQVAGRQDGRDGPGGGELLEVPIGQVVQVVHARGAQFDGKAQSVLRCGDLIAVHPQAEARLTPRNQDTRGLLAGEGAVLAEHVDEVAVLGDGCEHRTDHELEVLLGPVAVFAGHQVSAQERHGVHLPGFPQPGEDAGRAGLILDGQPIAGLRLQGRGAPGDGLVDPLAHELFEPRIGGLAGRVGRDLDTAGGIGLPGHASLELS